MKIEKSTQKLPLWYTEYGWSVSSFLCLAASAAKKKQQNTASSSAFHQQQI